MIWRCAALLVVVALVSGCNKQPKPTLMANMAKKEITVSQLRAIDYEYAARFGHAVAASAHEIVTEAEDADVVEHALRWRMWATPQARAAAFAQDPLTALIELWILASQQHQFFAVGEGKTWFGAQQQHALLDARPASPRWDGSRSNRAFFPGWHVARRRTWSVP